MSDYVDMIVNFSAYLVQAAAVMLLLWGIVKALYSFIKSQTGSKVSKYHMIIKIRWELWSVISLAITFLIASTIMNTINAPSWEEIGELAAIVLLRTFINYFLMKDVKCIRDDE